MCSSLFLLLKRIPEVPINLWIIVSLNNNLYASWLRTETGEIRCMRQMQWPLCELVENHWDRKDVWNSSHREPNGHTHHCDSAAKELVQLRTGTGPMFVITAENVSGALTSVWHPLQEIRYLDIISAVGHASKMQYTMASKWFKESWVYWTWRREPLGKG